MTTPLTVCQQIFQHVFDVGVQGHYLYSAEALRDVTPMGSVHPDQVIDDMMSFREGQMTIAAMIVFKVQGAPLQFRRAETALAVYQLLTRHLRNWVDKIRLDRVYPLPPIEELMAMDQLAGELHPIVYSYFPHEVIKPSGFGTRLELLSNAFLSREAPKIQPQQVPHMYPYNPAMVEIFELRPNL